MKYLIAVVVGLVGLVGIVFMSYVSAYNAANRMENQIVATFEDNKNVLAQYSNRIAEAAQIPAMQRDDLVAVVTAALDARYGEEGSKAMFQFIQEQNPNIDSSVYTQLQRMIEAGRIDFATAQTRLIDQKRVYDNARKSFWQGFWMRVAGYPKINLDDYKIVTNARTEEAFKTGVEEPMKLR